MARFFKEISVESITRVELVDPLRKIKLFDLTGVESHALTLDQVPQKYRPYKGCLFDVLSEPNCDDRRSKLKEFFHTVGSPGDPARECGLLYTIMHVWRHIYFIAMHEELSTATYATFDYFLDTGFIACFLRLVEYCFEQEFMLIEYNRYVPYRCIEAFFAGTQSDTEHNEKIVGGILEDEEVAYRVIWGLLNRKISWLEEMVCVQLLGNLSCFPQGVEFLLSHPEVVGVAGTYLWKSYETIFLNYQQFEDRKLTYQKAILTTDIVIAKRPQGDQIFKPTPARYGDLTVVVTLCMVCNVCAAHPDEAPMERVQPCLAEVVVRGLYDNIGSICCGILLNQSQYRDLTLEKFLSFLSWSTFNKDGRRLLLEQIRQLPRTRQEELLFFERDSFTLSRSVLACFISHALWVDNAKGSHYSILGLIALLTEDDDVAVDIVKLVGPQLFDIAHSIHHAKMPGDGDPLSMKRVVLETFLRLSGGVYFTERGVRSKPIPRKLDVLPPCVLEGRSFCERYTREMKTSKVEKQIAVRQADAFKTEGNNFFGKQEFESAVICYTRALETCPLTCTERRVTYYSNRAECYLKTRHPYKAISDCNRALAMNPNNIKARWRRAQAMQTVNMKYPAALDLWTIRGKPDQAKEILGEQVYASLEVAICELLDSATFLSQTEEKYGVMVYTGKLKRSGVNKDNVEDKLSLPPHRGQTYQDIFGLPEPDPHF